MKFKAPIAVGAFLFSLNMINFKYEIIDKKIDSEVYFGVVSLYFGEI